MVFPAVFIALYVGHHVADHWIQTDWQARHKGQPDDQGHLACLAHVATLTFTQVLLLGLLEIVLDFRLSPAFFVLGLTLNAISHFVIDKRYTLRWVAQVWPFGKLGYYENGGAYHLDQTAHFLFIFLSALVISL